MHNRVLGTLHTYKANKTQQCRTEENLAKRVESTWRWNGRQIGSKQILEWWSLKLLTNEPIWVTSITNGWFSAAWLLWTDVWKRYTKHAPTSTSFGLLWKSYHSRLWVIWPTFWDDSTGPNRVWNDAAWTFWNEQPTISVRLAARDVWNADATLNVWRTWASMEHESTRLGYADIWQLLRRSPSSLTTKLPPVSCAKNRTANPRAIEVKINIAFGDLRWTSVASCSEVIN